MGRFKEAGAAGLAHGNRGRPALNRLAVKTRQRVLELVKETYQGFNDTHLCETLAEHEKIVMGCETLRSSLRSEGIGPKRRRRVRQHRRRREPRPCRAAPGSLTMYLTLAISCLQLLHITKNKLLGELALGISASPSATARLLRRKAGAEARWKWSTEGPQ